MFEKITNRRILYFSGCFVIFFIVLASRRYQQFLLPQVWGEDGTEVLRSFIEHGWLGFFETMNGYFITSSKVISFIALNISFVYFPLISTILTFIFTAGIGLAVVLSPTYLRAKFLCGLVIFLLPVYPEVFGVPLYSFWWASILLFLLVLWDQTQDYLAWRLMFLFIGGLSSPVIMIVLPVFYWRAWAFRKNNSELVIAFFASVLGAIQMHVIAKWGLADKASTDSVIMHVLPTYLGSYLVGNISYNLFLWWVSALLLLMAIAMWIVSKPKNWQNMILLYLYVALVALNTKRIGILEIQPDLPIGSRYFFLPYVLLSWILIQVFFAVERYQFRLLLGLMVLVIAVNSSKVWFAMQNDFEWASHVRSCPYFNHYAIPTSWDGGLDKPWYLELQGDTCGLLLQNDKLASKKIIRSPVFPYVVTFNSPDKKYVKGRVVSRESSDEVSINLQHGDVVLYQSNGNSSYVIIQGHEQKFITALPRTPGPIWLNFSNNKLPDKFMVKFKGQ